MPPRNPNEKYKKCAYTVTIFKRLNHLKAVELDKKEKYFCADLPQAP